METNRRGECTNCQILWCWVASAAMPGVRRGEAFCKVCGCQLRCVGRGRDAVLSSREGQPLRASAAGVVREKRIAALAKRDIPFSVHTTASFVAA